MLNKGRLRGKVYYIRMKDFKDFGEIFETLGKEGLINCIRSAKQFTEFELVF
jgi:hypothetical protein